MDGALTLTLFDPGYARFCDPPTFSRSGAFAPAHPAPAACERRPRRAERGRVIVPCKDWRSATAYGGCGLDKGLSPPPFATKRSMAQTVRARQRWVRLFEHTWVHSHERRGGDVL
jgi:hypothetical protein